MSEKRRASAKEKKGRGALALSDRSSKYTKKEASTRKWACFMYQKELRASSKRI